MLDETILSPIVCKVGFYKIHRQISRLRGTCRFCYGSVARKGERSTSV